MSHDSLRMYQISARHLLTHDRILEPDGVVEFLEVDPRPRLKAAGSFDEPPKDDHKSWVPTDWTDKIFDRFQNPYDKHLAKDVPGWVGRVEERLKAKLRPRHGVSAPNLKSWLEGSGYFSLPK